MKIRLFTIKIGARTLLTYFVIRDALGRKQPGSRLARRLLHSFMFLPVFISPRDIPRVSNRQIARRFNHYDLLSWGVGFFVFDVFIEPFLMADMGEWSRIMATILFWFAWVLLTQMIGFRINPFIKK